MPGSDTVIRVEHLCKEYRLGVIGHGTLYRDLQSWWARLRGRDDPNSRVHLSGRPSVRAARGRFPALDDVSFTVERGEILGIIGHNGAGKSTLLKILSRITAPTAGRIEYRDNIASLLEVGTGFHSELTGRENIYMNGAMLGMTRVEIERKFDAIVDFSGVAAFLDTPVKRYSSGMSVRLAFAVAAHLDAEILLIDEVLAVGDMEFQKKCLGKMREVTQEEGRTVLIVSHNLATIRQLCRRAIVLDHGRAVLDTDDVAAAVDLYRNSFQSDGRCEWTNDGKGYGDPLFTPIRVRLADAEGRTVESPIHARERVCIEFEGTVEKPSDELCLGYVLHAENGTPLYCSFSHDSLHGTDAPPRSGHVVFRSPIPTDMLNEGGYEIVLWIHHYTGEQIVHPNIREEGFSFRIDGTPSLSPYWHGKRQGLFAPVLPWTCDEVPQPVD